MVPCWAHVQHGPGLPFPRCELAMSGTWDDGAREGLCCSADGNAQSGRALLLLCLHLHLLCCVVFFSWCTTVCAWEAEVYHPPHHRLEDKGQWSSLLILYSIICVCVCLRVYKCIIILLDTAQWFMISFILGGVWPPRNCRLHLSFKAAMSNREM